MKRQSIKIVLVSMSLHVVCGVLQDHLTIVVEVLLWTTDNHRLFHVPVTFSIPLSLSSVLNSDSVGGIPNSIHLSTCTGSAYLLCVVDSRLGLNLFPMLLLLMNRRLYLFSSHIIGRYILVGCKKISAH